MEGIRNDSVRYLGDGSRKVECIGINEVRVETPRKYYKGGLEFPLLFLFYVSDL